MGRIVLLLGFLASQVSAQGLPAVKGNDVWVVKNIKWEKAPRDYNPNLSSAPATVLYFRPDGRFGMIRCRLNKGLDYLVVSQGDGQKVSEGTWRTEAKGIAIRYRLTSVSVSRVPPERLPGDEESAMVEFTSRGELRIGTQLFVPFGDRLKSTELEPEFFHFR